MKRVLGCLGFLVAVGVGAGCGASGDGVFDEKNFPFTFEYPGSFSETDDVTVDQDLGGGGADAQHAIVLDESNVIAVQRFTLKVVVDESNLDAAKPEFDALLRQVDPKADSVPTKVAGLPALEFDAIAVPSVEGGESRLIGFFDGDQEYLINCQSTTELREEVEAACDRALQTLELK